MGLLMASLCAGSAGCASQAPSREELQTQLAAYHQALVERDQRLAQLHYQSSLLARGQAVLTAQLDQARRAERLVTNKLEELIELNGRIEAQLQVTEERLQAAEGETETEPAGQTPSDLERAQVELLRELRDAHAARNEAMKELARTVQYLVDTGQLHISRDDVKPTISVPRSLDIEDPWRYR